MNRAAAMLFEAFSGTVSGVTKERLLRALAIACVVAGLAWTLHAIDLGSLRMAIARTMGWPLAIACFANFAILGCKAFAWHVLLAPDHRVSTRRLMRYTVIAYAASAALPLRAGELLRVWLLREQDGVPVSYSAAVVIAEKLLDVVSLLLLTGVTPLVVDAMPRATGMWIVGLSGGVLGALVIARRLGPRLARCDGWRGGLGRGLGVLRDRRRWLPATGVLLGSWLIDLAMIDLLIYAVGIDLPLGAGVLLVFAINVAVALPSTPGQIGALELGAVLGLQVLHVPAEQALVFAVIYHALQLIPTVALGLALGAGSLWRAAPRTLDAADTRR